MKDLIKQCLTKKEKKEARELLIFFVESENGMNTPFENFDSSLFVAEYLERYTTFIAKVAATDMPFYEMSKKIMNDPDFKKIL